MAGFTFPTGRLRPVFLCAALALSSLIPAAANAQAARLPVATLTIGHQRITAEVAATGPEQEHGLMGRESLPANHGMLFVFDRPEAQCFWMKNTPLPLSIAFITAAGTILSIQKMAPFSEAVHCPPGPILYALEMRQGWFAQAGVGTGATVSGLPSPGKNAPQ